MVAGLIPPFEMQVDPQELANLERVFADMPEKIDKILYRAINTAVGKMRTLVARAVRSSLPGLKIRDIRKRIWLVKANRRKLHAVLIGGKVGWPLIDFGAVQTGKAPKPGGGVDVADLAMSIPHAFIARMPSGHEGVFLRTGAKAIMSRGAFMGRRREPIKEQRSRDITEIVERTAAMPEILQLGQATLSKRVVAEMELILSGKRS